MFDKKNTVILVAIEEELPQKLIPEWKIIYTGVGKVNAAISISEAYFKLKPRTFINYGSAGSLSKNITGLQQVIEFKQRDMDARQMGFSLGETPFDKVSSIRFPGNGVSCSTGDNFVSAKPEIETDIVDMESYSYAKFCLKHNLNFYCYKYISDNANEIASNDWINNFSKGSNLFIDKINS